MRPYDRSQPLIFIHVPKTAGTSVRTLFARWFEDGLLSHYIDEPTGALPPRRDLAALHSRRRPVAVYGHFNSLRGSGVAEYYPQVRQFVTILRDPFDAAISNYHFAQRVGHRWADASRVPRQGLRNYLLETPPNLLHHFPRPLTAANHRALLEEDFIEIGVMEQLHESLRRIAAKLDLPFDPRWLTHANATPRGEPDPQDLRPAHRERFPLEYAIYDEAAARYADRGAWQKPRLRGPRRLARGVGNRAALRIVAVAAAVLVGLGGAVVVALLR